MNTPRRTLSDTLTRAERTFLAVADGVKMPPHESAEANPLLQPQPSDRRRSPQSRIRSNERSPLAGSRPQPLRTVTIRLHASIADALRRESIKRSLNYIEPFSQQAIVEAALRDWLKIHGSGADDES